MDTQRGIIDTGDQKRWEDERRGRASKLPTGYNFHYSGDGYAKSPEFTTTQYKLNMYPLNLKKIIIYE